MDTPDGPFFGCNLDLFMPGDGLVFANQRGVVKKGWMESTTGEVAEWTSEYGSVTFSLAGREFAWSGMNEAGLVVSSMQLASGEYPERDERPALSDGQVVQYMLDSCGTVAEALEAITSVRVEEKQSPPSHYLLADEGGDCAAIEYVDGDLLIHTGDDLPVRAMANMPYSRSAEAYERGGSRWWWSNPGQSAERVAAAEKRSLGFDAASDTSAVNYAFSTLVYYVAAPHTRWSIVYDITARKLYYRTDQSPTYKYISLNAFDFSCESPVLMLDVNAPLESGVEEDFVPYDTAVNRDVFITFCTGWWGTEVSEENADALMEHIDAFECAE
jgi:choloylglycine hydrolase